MQSLTLRQMRYFEALARQGHFGRAAEVCAVSQPALSVQIKEMEAELGAPLFDRAPRQVRLTPFGQAVAPRIRDVLRGVEALGDVARAHASDVRLRIGVIPTIGPYLLPRMVGVLAAAHPGMQVDLRETVTGGLIGELADGRLDAALVALPVSEPSLVEVELFTEDFVLVRPEADRDAPLPDRDALREMRLLLLEEGHCFRDQALSFCARGPGVRPGLEASSLSTLVQMVGAGLGVTLIPEMAVDTELRAAAVAVARFPPPAPGRRVGMVWRRGSPLGDRLAEVADSLRDGLRR